MNTRTRLFATLLLLAVLALSAAPVFGQNAREELHVWVLTFAGPSVTDAWNKVIADFEAANPDIKVVLEQRSTDAHKDALRVVAGTEAAPDIYFMWAGLGLGGEFVNLGVSDVLDAEYEALGWNDRFVGASLSKTIYDGMHQAVPYTVHGMVVYYRTDLFEKAGITAEPQTYEELLAANDALVAAGIAPFSFGGSVNWHLMRLLDTLIETKCGAAMHDALKAMTVSWVEEPCATAAFEELDRWNKAGYLGQNYMGINQDDAALLVYTDQAAMLLEGDWMVQAIEDQGEDLANYGVFVFPTGTNRLYAFAENLYITAGTPRREAAVKFLDFLTSTPVQQEHLGVFGAISVNEDVVYPADRRPLDVEWSEIFAAYGETYEPGDQAFPLAVNTEYWRIQNGVLTGEIAAADAAGLLQTFIDNFLANKS
jgi:raffinose/stachyose/melibiose transport system substrate-binding protein